MSNSPLANLRSTRAVLDEFGLTAKYKLGQNFLVDDTVIGKILDLAALTPEDTVLEVGPGIGTLTCALLPHVNAVIALEADTDLVQPLEFTTRDYSERFALVLGDALEAEPARLEQALSELVNRGGVTSPATGLPNCWVSNLPYAVAATLIFKYFESWDFIKEATVMVQSEVADRISASPGNKTYGAYTAKLALYANVTGRFEVPPNCFFPAPHVSSAVIKLERKPQAELLPAQEANEVCTVIDAAFAQRRKTIRNSMTASGLFEKPLLDAAFEQTGISPTCRAETLSTCQFISLAQALRCSH
ncbi:MAG: 16S rRNA (adenine(1518)-N(6)/adenine(1519)-N(6))-dimethyltransferase RsmA [Coriobacteriales bacterium]|nr:16S rRNA (adenine(1518)-N(6)/adenine(1519)-N(6))-dimethyltransferase RsmA [Coriobacteriales bacterium]